MNEFCNLIADQKRVNTKHEKQNTTSKYGTNFCSKKNELRDGEDVPFT